MMKTNDEDLPYGEDGKLEVDVMAGEVTEPIESPVHLPKEMIELLRADFSEDSLQNVTKFGKELVGIDPQYVAERANDVFGHRGWSFEVKNHAHTDTNAWVLGRLSILDENGNTIKFIEQFGDNTINKAIGLGDALKGATTNSFGKCCSWFDIAHKAYKGLLKLPKGKSRSESQGSGESSGEASEKQLKYLGFLSDTKQSDDESYKKYMVWRGKETHSMDGAKKWIEYFKAQKDK